MADKFGRNYLLEVETLSGTTLKIQPPFTVEFDITRNLYGSANVGSIRVYNLSTQNRNQVRQNVWDTGQNRQATLRAGYGTNLAIMFTGRITQAWSVREGTNFITQIESFDGGFAFINGKSDISFPSGTPQQTIITTLAGSLPGVELGSIGTFQGTIPRGNSYSGSTTDILAQLTNGGFFIDNGRVNCLGDSECIAGETPIINADSGLLGTPVLEQTILYFDMIFEPSLFVGQQVILQSSTDFTFNGLSKIVSLKHRGTISGAVCGNAITSVGLDFSRPTFSLVPRAS